MSSRWKIGSIGGIPVYLASSFVWIVLLYTYSLYLRFFYGRVDASKAMAVALAVFSAVLFFGSILAHELAHAGVARAFALPVSGITLLFWGGATETKADLKGPKGEFLVSGAGPATSLAVGGLFLVVATGLEGARPLVAEAFRYVGVVNILLAGLNAIPGFPLDGGRMLLSGVWAITGNKTTATRVAGWAGMTVGTGFAVFGFLQVRRGDTGFGFWFFFLAWILISTARGTERRLQLRAQLATGRAAEAMRPPPIAIPTELSLADALRDYLRGSPEASFPVVEAGRVVGEVSMRSARRIGGRDPMRPVRDGMTPLWASPVVGLGDTLDDALDLLGGRQGIVLDGERLVGSLSPDDIERWYQARLRGAAPGPPAPEHAPPPRPDL